MIQSFVDHSDNENECPMFTVRRHDHREQVSYEDLFAAGHRIWLKGNYIQARAVFARLAEFTANGPRAAIFLAHCHAMLDDYGSCSAVLNRALPGETYRDAAARLHEAFVFWKVGLFVEVKATLKSLALEFAELPTVSLILADLLQRTGASALAVRFLRRAIQHDRPDGGVALAARSTLQDVQNQ